MEKKYSTGTKGRLEKHADQCKEIIRTRCNDFHLGGEYIESIDPARENKVWQQYQTPEDCLPDLEIWLGEEPPALPEKPPAAVKIANVKPASQLPSIPSPVRDTLKKTVAQAMERTRTWLAKAGTQEQLSALDPNAAIDLALDRLEREIVDPEAL